jgi:hypothetical protein
LISLICILFAPNHIAAPAEERPRLVHQIVARRGRPINSGFHLRKCFARLLFRPELVEQRGQIALLHRARRIHIARGTPAQNLRLSRERAEQLRLALVTMGVPGERLSAVGKGSSEPLNARDPRAPENRRVRVVPLP